MAEKMTDKTLSASAADTVPVSPAGDQYNRYNMTLPQSFSIYNDEGSVLYRGEVEQMANQLRAELFGVENKEEPQKEAPVQVAKKGAKAYDKKRSFFLVLPLILSVVLLAIFVIGVLPVAALDSVKQYISIYNVNYATVTPIAALDPAVGFLTTKFGIEISALPTDFIQLYPVGEEALSVAAGYALSIATILYVVFTLILLIVSLVGLCGKKKADGTYGKAKLGFLSIVLFLCGLIVAVGGLTLSGGTLKDILPFITGSYELELGYGLIAMIAIPVITFLCTCFAYGKKKN